MKKMYIKIILAIAIGILAGEFAGTRVSDKELNKNSTYTANGVVVEKYFNTPKALIAGGITASVFLLILLIPELKRARAHKRKLRK